MKKIIVLLLLMTGIAAHAQVNQILGDWMTVDDKTGANYSVVTIYQGSDGLYYGKISKMLVGGSDQVCVKCTGEDANAKLEGLVFIRGMQEKEDQLQGGRVLDPESGKFYYGKIYLKDGKLVLRGSLDKRGLIGRSQTWVRK